MARELKILGGSRLLARGVAAASLLVFVLSQGAEAEPATDRDDLIGEVATYQTRYEDTLVDLARRFNLGYVELVAANPGIDPWVPGAGTTLVIPGGHILPDAPRQGIVINLAELRLYYFPGKGGTVITHPIGIGREGWETPTGRTEIVHKRVNPTWIPPDSIRAERPELPPAVPPGPDNPLGAFALNLSWPRYVIHGTNNPWGVGRRVSSGCIRLYPEDIEALFPRLPVGTPVAVVDQPVKVGWSKGELYLEVSPSRTQSDEIEEKGRLITREPLPDLAKRIVETAGTAVDRLDWSAVRRAAIERSGVPVRITS